jgi:hypothetical protein
MPFELLDSLTLPGDPAKPSDDAMAHESASAVVLDGATGLGEPLLDGASDAAWVAHFGAERLMAHMALGGRCEDALRESLRETEAEFVRLRRRVPEEIYEIPFASMMFVALDDGQMHASWFGDCAALVRRPGEGIEVLGDAIAKRGRERERVAALAASLGADAAGSRVRDMFLPALRRARNTINTEKGGWLFGPDIRAAEHVSSASIAAPAGTLVLLVTDGFLALASDYDEYTLESLFDAVHSSGLALLGAQLRAVEDADPGGKRFPRFKKSDDATAMLLRVTA